MVGFQPLSHNKLKQPSGWTAATKGPLCEIFATLGMDKPLDPTTLFPGGFVISHALVYKVKSITTGNGCLSKPSEHHGHLARKIDRRSVAGNFSVRSGGRPRKSERAARVEALPSHGGKHESPGLREVLRVSRWILASFKNSN